MNGYWKYLDDVAKARQSLLDQFGGDVPWDHPEFRIDEDWIETDTKGIFEPDDDLVAAAKEAAMAGWRERASQYGNAEPKDLSNSCLFTALFVKVLFGGVVAGNKRHVFNRVGGRVIDLNADAEDVVAMGRSARRHDGRFFSREGDALAEQFTDNFVRVRRWVEAFVLAHGHEPATPTM